MSKNSYDDSSIQVLEGLEHVRKRPGMYIGSTDERGLHHLVWEIVDNSIDEALAGYGKEIVVTINEDNSITVEDSGRGVPCGMHETGKNTMEIIYTKLNAGGKFGGGGYKTSGGLHGVGASVTNALSSFMEVTSYRDGKIHKITFKHGGTVVSPVEVLGDTRRTGTTVHFKPDPSVFTTTVYQYDTIKTRIRESAFLIKGLKMTLKDKRSGKNESFQYENGISEYVAFLTTGKSPMHNVAYFDGEYKSDVTTTSADGKSQTTTETIEVEVAFQFLDSYNETLISFVNNVKTPDGGTHETGYKTALTRAFNDYAHRAKLIRENQTLEGADIRTGLTSVVSVRIGEKQLEFEGQTKAKLGTPQAKTAVDNVVGEKLTFFLMENKDLAEKIVKKAQKEAEARAAARKAREQARLDKKDKGERNISTKLAPTSEKNKEINELYLVEGDSAGGSAKQGRDRRFQAILPLRGKVLNTERATIDAALKNEEINTMIYTIGAGYGPDFDLKKCNYKKIIIMTDADDDGAHIQVLLLTFFFNHMRPLVEDGRIYLALPPLFKITKRGKTEEIVYAWTNEEKDKILASCKCPTILQRYKGLGEMNAEQLWETTMNPETRTLVQVHVEDEAEAESQVNVLMGSDSERRRNWLENHVSFTLEEE
ncbi:MAG: DNA topoisomerase IV subunit B [Anaeroplasma sp.]|uniref:DNA topoisomerase IV subunit B n=1 Tax=Anaeroplasma sp. TaxID=1872523 RepID=UPI002A91B0A7|nr:DNA topoisomerase IV subunit B [Anaeroplasma sp.]MDY5982507.1 DNA topoisomerase IV subunit B [Anaeroplasma sp.]